jgi:hypothetical protein
VRFFRAANGLAWIAALGLSCQLFAQEQDKRSSFKDPEDGKLDASEWLLDRKGFLPVPILITEPAVGYGAGAALLFLRESIREAAARGKDSGHVTPPDIYAVAFAATENGTKFGGAGGMVTFDNDRWRWRGGVGLADVNLDFFGAGGVTGTADRSIGYNLNGFVSSQQVMYRLAESNNFVAGRWIYLDLDTSFDASRQLPALQPRSLAVKSSGLGVAFEHDSRDNIFTPSRGWKGNIDAVFYSPDIGSDNKYETYHAHLYGYFPFARQFVLGTRLDARSARGDVPFYQLPYIDLRGIPAARYQDESAGVAEAELRWKVDPRWALIGFFGTGRTWGSSKNSGDADSVNAWGVGFRYLIARRLGLYMGADIAKGPEDTAFYIQAGSAWR